MPARTPFYSITAKADTSHAEILIYDEIGPANFWTDTVDAKSFVKDLQSLEVDTITQSRASENACSARCRSSRDSEE